MCMAYIVNCKNKFYTDEYGEIRTVNGLYNWCETKNEEKIYLNVLSYLTKKNMTDFEIYSECPIFSQNKYQYDFAILRNKKNKHLYLVNKSTYEMVETPFNILFVENFSEYLLCLAYKKCSNGISLYRKLEYLDSSFCTCHCWSYTKDIINQLIKTGYYVDKTDDGEKYYCNPEGASIFCVYQERSYATGANNMLWEIFEYLKENN